MMRGAEFDELVLTAILQRARGIAETMVQGTDDLRSVQEKVAAEFAAAIAEVNRKIYRAQTHLSVARSRKAACAAGAEEAERGKRPPRPAPEKPVLPPSVSEEAVRTAEAAYSAEVQRTARENERIARENAECDGRALRFRKCGAAADTAVCALERCLEILRAQAAQLAAAQKEYDEARISALERAGGAAQKMNAWCGAAKNSLDRAEDVLHCRDRGGGEMSGFVLSPKRSASKAGTGQAVGAATGGHSEEGETVVLREKDAQKALSQLAGVAAGVVVKIPAADLHSLGGKQFLADMEADFTLVSEGGGLVGNDGYIAWRKKQ